MATLQIKTLQAALYGTLRALLMGRRLNNSERLSTLAMQGLGKNTWRSVDATAHVDRERSSWE